MRLEETVSCLSSLVAVPCDWIIFDGLISRILISGKLLRILTLGCNFEFYYRLKYFIRSNFVRRVLHLYKQYSFNKDISCKGWYIRLHSDFGLWPFDVALNLLL